MAAPLKIGIVGFGKIAADQHQPAIAASPDFELAAVASGSLRGIPGVPAVYPTLAAMLAGEPGLDAVAICTPPGPRPALAREALAAGRHVLLEKPPAATLSEAEELAGLAAAPGRPVLFATWHSRFNAAVEEARQRLSGQRIVEVQVTWREDVRRWHPGQDWVWQPGGFGVFDPGINALSILTQILPGPLAVADATLEVPTNRQTPIAARLQLRLPDPAARLSVELDWRQTGPQSWDITIRTAQSLLTISGGGGALAVDGATVSEAPRREYADIYSRFAALIRERRSDADLRPLRLVADAFLVGKRVATDAFDW